MPLKNIVEDIINIAKNQPNIGYVGYGDVYQLNSVPNIDYSVFFVTQQNHSLENDIMTYNLTLFYIDRLLNDESNMLQIHSQGILEINNIVNLFNEISDDEIDLSVNYTTFTHRFTDNCAGVFATVKITSENDLGICGYGSI